MLRPEKQWAVGDKTFATYEEARTYISTRRGELIREELVDEIQGEIKASGYDYGVYGAENIADVILKKFKISRRK